MINKRDNVDLEDFAYQSIIRMIVEDGVKPGDAILETELSEQFGISRTPVRQALGRLVAEGFLEKKRKKGCVIPLPSPKDAKQVFSAREVMEGHVAALAAINADDTDIARLKKFFDEQLEAVTVNDKTEYTLANEKFHFGIMKAARNGYLERYCRNIFWRSNIYIFYFDSFYSQTGDSKLPTHQMTPIQHARILKAIENKDPENAKKEMKEHIRNTYNMLLGSGK